MTHDELMLLPEESTAIGSRIVEMKGGARVCIPVPPKLGALFMGPNDGAFTDNDGARWMVGESNGVRVRRRIR